MKAIIEIDMSGAAFDDCPALEASYVLRKVEKSLIHASVSGKPATGTVLDSNGNTCGTFRIEE